MYLISIIREYYAPTNVFSTTPLGIGVGYSGRFDSKPLPLPGAFDLLLVFNKTL